MGLRPKTDKSVVPWWDAGNADTVIDTEIVTSEKSAAGCYMAGILPLPHV